MLLTILTFIIYINICTHILSTNLVTDKSEDAPFKYICNTVLNCYINCNDTSIISEMCDKGELHVGVGLSSTSPYNNKVI